MTALQATLIGYPEHGSIAKIELDRDQERGQKKSSQRKVAKTMFVLMLINVVYFPPKFFLSKGHFQTFKDCGATMQLSF